MSQELTCIKCKRPLLEHEQNQKGGIAFCYGCNYYFPSNLVTDRRREEVVVPNGTSFIRLRLKEDSIEISVRWFRNYSLKEMLFGFLGAEAKSIVLLASYFINKTSVVANRKYLKIETNPIDVMPAVFYRPSYVKQLYVKKKGLLIKNYGLYARLSDGKEELLLWDLDKKILLFIEQEIERLFGIEDQKIKGEVV